MGGGLGRRQLRPPRAVPIDHPGVGGGGLRREAPRPVRAWGVQHPRQPEPRPRMPGLGRAFEAASDEARGAGQPLLAGEAQAVGGGRVARLAVARGSRGLSPRPRPGGGACGGGGGGEV